MKAKNGIDWDEFGFTVYGECPEYKGIYTRKKRKNTENISHSDSYKKWQRLIAISRGQAEDKKATICNEWLEYENFKKWYDGHYYSVGDEKMSLSYRVYDLNNHYISPETCVFIPQKILKSLLIFRLDDGGLPCGIQLEKDTYTIRISNYQNGKSVLRTKKYHVALQRYYEVKKEIFNGLLEEYESNIPVELSDRLKNFSIGELKHE